MVIRGGGLIVIKPHPKKKKPPTSDGRSCLSVFSLRGGGRNFRMSLDGRPEIIKKIIVQKLGRMPAARETRLLNCSEMLREGQNPQKGSGEVGLERKGGEQIPKVASTRAGTRPLNRELLCER